MASTTSVNSVVVLLFLSVCSLLINNCKCRHVLKFDVKIDNKSKEHPIENDVRIVELDSEGNEKNLEDSTFPPDLFVITETCVEDANELKVRPSRCIGLLRMFKQFFMGIQGQGENRELQVYANPRDEKVAEQRAHGFGFLRNFFQ